VEGSQQAIISTGMSTEIEIMEQLLIVVSDREPLDVHDGGGQTEPERRFAASLNER